MSDVWGESSDEGQGDLDREWQARHQSFWNLGYQEGVHEGKEQTVQQGFDIGFREGAAAGREWGALNGAMTTLRIFSECAPASMSAADMKRVAELGEPLLSKEAIIALCEGIVSKSVAGTLAAADQQSRPPETEDVEALEDLSLSTAPNGQQPAAASSTATAAVGAGLARCMHESEVEELAQIVQAQVARLGIKLDTQQRREKG